MKIDIEVEFGVRIKSHVPPCQMDEGEIVKLMLDNNWLPLEGT